MQVVLPTRLSPVLAGAALLLVAACSAPAPAPATAPPAPAAAAEAHGGAHGGAEEGAHGGVHGSTTALGLYAVQSGPLGVIATDAEGHILYMHTADTPSSSACTEACAQEWVPVVMPADPGQFELLGIDQELVGQLPRAEGMQLTLNGHPLYRRADDIGGLTTAGAHGAEGRWFAITPKGEQVA